MHTTKSFLSTFYQQKVIGCSGCEGHDPFTPFTEGKESVIPPKSYILRRKITEIFVLGQEFAASLINFCLVGQNTL